MLRELFGERMVPGDLLKPTGAQAIDAAVPDVPDGGDAPAVADEHGDGRPHLPVPCGRGDRTDVAVGAPYRFVDEPHAIGEASVVMQHGIDVAADDVARLAASLAAAHAVCDAEHKRLLVDYNMVLVLLANKTALARERDVDLEPAASPHKSEQHGVYPPLTALKTARTSASSARAIAVAAYRTPRSRYQGSFA